MLKIEIAILWLNKKFVNYPLSNFIHLKQSIMFYIYTN